MRNTLYTFAILLGITLHVQAQQVSLNSQYLFNEYILNPAAVGSKDYTPVQLNFRKQWTNFPGAPTTQFLHMAEWPIKWESGQTFITI